jgi:hypothetical protein
MQSWSMAINAGTATVDTPPPDLIKALMPARSGSMNPMRNPDHETSKSSKTASASASAMATPSGNPFLTPYPYPMPSYPFYSPYGPPPPQTPIPMHATVSVDVHVQLQSSPGVSEGDQAERLMDYVEWLARKTPSQAELFIECKEALRTGGHTFKTIKDVTDAQFDKMNISDGIAMQLKTHLRKFERAMLGHV